MSASRARDAVPRHPAKFTSSIIEAFEVIADRVLPDGARILDPFAGVGTIHRLRPRWETWGMEIEPEWAAASKWTCIGDSRSQLGRLIPSGTFFDAVMTSPCYGNRMADHHEAVERCRKCQGDGFVVLGFGASAVCEKCDGTGRRTHRRNTYRHALGRPLTAGNAGGLQWGPEYRALHREVYAACREVLKPGGIFVLNMSDHIRKGEVVPVTAWHVDSLWALGFTEVRRWPMPTPRLRHGENHELRVDHEDLVLLQLDPPEQVVKPLGDVL